MLKVCFGSVEEVKVCYTIFILKILWPLYKINRKQILVSIITNLPYLTVDDKKIMTVM